ncbi:hypothetical protein pZL12.72c [Streptomyces phage ZL12]|uniref:Uncharacterized protein n=1 Tax=Streptomyces phage ZL12 TaxID=2570911 RepID=D0UWH7_9CAUD|nr:hypothetical protein QEH43_gp072 [Streptomyces phage ZL12]ACX71149.1 hypothetical protein pZL12.72c [Streptomyces phage ZL12]
MSADSLFTLDPASTPQPGATASDGSGGGAGRGGSQNGSQGPLVVVQQPRNPAPPRPAPQRSQGNTDNSMRNGYAAISHSVSGETAAIGVGFILGGPVGAVIGGAAGPVIAAAMMWRNRGREHNETTNQNTTSGSNGRDSSGSAGRGNGGGGGGRGNGSGGGQHRTPNNSGSGSGSGSRDTSRRPKTKDPVADKLSKAGKDLADKLKRSRTDRAKNPKNNKGDWTGKGKGGTAPKGAGTSKGGSGKGTGTGGSGTGKGTGGGADAKTTSRGGLKTKDRGPQPDSPRPWRNRGPKDKNKKKTSKGDDTAATTAPDGLSPKTPKPDDGGLPSKPTPKPDEYIDAELVDDDHPASPDPDNDQSFSDDDIVDAVIVEDPEEQAEKKKAEDRIALVRAKRVKEKRRAAAAAGKKAAEKAARDGDMGDPAAVKAHVTQRENRVIDLEIHHENHLIALTQAAEKPRSTPVNYPAIQAAPTGTRTAGVAIARQINVRGTTAYLILRTMADQLAHGLHGDDNADMGDHIVELTGIPNMCKNLSVAVQEASRALARTAPLHPSVIKHLNNAAVAARTAGVMAENIMVVFVQAHREDIIRILDPRIGEERWNIRNAPGTLDAAKLRAAIASAHSTRLALPSGSATSPGGGSGGSKLVPASDGSTRKLIDLMKNFKRGHMVNVLSEVAGSAAGVDAVADSITKMYKRMQKTWPTENVVDDTVARTAGQVRRVSVELHKAIKAAQKAHQRELRLNAKGRAGKGARVERKWDVVGRPSSSN